MSYADHFDLADNLIDHLDTVLQTINDPFIESRYTGFVAVSSVTVLELALKSIFIAFAEAKHKVMGQFVAAHYDKLNGRIGLDAIKGDYLKKFGPKYQTRFSARLNRLEQDSLRNRGQSITASYGNLLVWRNTFAHQGTVPNNASYSEVKRAYDCGKAVMHCLDGCMKR